MARRHSLLKSKAVIFTVYSSELRLWLRLNFSYRPQRQVGLCNLAAMTAFLHRTSESIEIKINYRCGIERQKLREQQAADNGDAHGPAQFTSRPGFQRKR